MESIRSNGEPCASPKSTGLIRPTEQPRVVSPVTLTPTPSLLLHQTSLRCGSIVSPSPSDQGARIGLAKPSILVTPYRHRQVQRRRQSERDSEAGDRFIPSRSRINTALCRRALFQQQQQQHAELGSKRLRDETIDTALEQPPSQPIQRLSNALFGLDEMNKQSWMGIVGSASTTSKKQKRNGLPKNRDPDHVINELGIWMHSTAFGSDTKQARRVLDCQPADLFYVPGLLRPQDATTPSDYQQQEHSPRTLQPATGSLTSWNDFHNVLAIAGDTVVHFWDAETREVQTPLVVCSQRSCQRPGSSSSAQHRSTDTYPESDDHTTGDCYVASLQWCQSSCDLRRLAVGTRDGLVQIWDTERQFCLQILKAHSGTRITALAWNKYSCSLTTGGADANLHTFDLRERSRGSGEDGALSQVARFLNIGRGHKAAILSLMWNSDGTSLASASSCYSDTAVRIWDVRSYQRRGLQSCRTTLEQPVQTTGSSARDRITALAWCPFERQILAVGTAQGKMQLWNAIGERMLQSKDLSDHRGEKAESVSSIVWSRQQKELYCTQGKAIAVRQYPCLECVQKVTSDVTHLSLRGSRDGSTVASIGVDETLQVWKIRRNVGDFSVSDDRSVTLSSLSLGMPTIR
jgi:WD40 repeat protein